MDDMVVHLFVLIRVLEVVGTAIGGIEACQIEVAASLTWGFAIALDLAPFAFVAVEVSYKSRVVYDLSSRVINGIGLCGDSRVASMNSNEDKAIELGKPIADRGLTYHAIEMYYTREKQC